MTILSQNVKKKKIIQKKQKQEPTYKYTAKE